MRTELSGCVAQEVTQGLGELPTEASVKQTSGQMRADGSFVAI
jgi:hypothetical protein